MTTPVAAGLEQAEIDQLLQRLYTTETSEQCLEAAEQLADRVKESGLQTLLDTS